MSRVRHSLTNPLTLARIRGSDLLGPTPEAGRAKGFQALKLQGLKSPCENPDLIGPQRLKPLKSY